MNVSFEVEAPIAVLSIDRPARRNAVDRQTARELLEAFERFESDPELRVLVLSGKHGVFCAGADLKAFDNDARSASGPMGFTRRSASKPVIAAIEGHCVAGGLEIAAFCDLRVAAEGAILGCLERRFGVPLIDGGTQRLPRIVGLGRALDLILTGRPIDASEALEMGLVNRVVPQGTALAAARALAHQIAAFPWDCLLADRASLYEGLGRPLAEGLALEAQRGEDVLAEAARGAARFVSGTGRHGEPGDGA